MLPLKYSDLYVLIPEICHPGKKGFSSANSNGPTRSSILSGYKGAWSPLKHISQRNFNWLANEITNSVKILRNPNITIWYQWSIKQLTKTETPKWICSLIYSIAVWLSLSTSDTIHYHENCGCANSCVSGKDHCQDFDQHCMQLCLLRLMKNAIFCNKYKCADFRTWSMQIHLFAQVETWSCKRHSKNHTRTHLNVRNSYIMNI